LAIGAVQRNRLSGFTLLELLVVVSIVAVASAGVSLALRDSAQTQLEREAQRLVALLESGRAQSRTLGVSVVWRSTGRGFRFDGLPPGSLPEAWLDDQTRVVVGALLELGPDPVIARQRVTLVNSSTPAIAWRVETDGLRPFKIAQATVNEAP
jgi:general secretion pathway protein H